MQVSEYFDGKVKSIGFENSQGRATAGVMAVGQYEFGTSENEWMKIVSGQMSVQLPGDDSFVTYQSGQDFRVPAGAKFQVRVEQETAYVCFYG